MNRYSEDYCNEFDQELELLINENKFVKQYNQLVKRIENDEELKELVQQQKQLQKELMNLQALRQTEFSQIVKAKLAQIDEQLQCNGLLNELHQKNHLIKLQQSIINDELNTWKDKYVIKNKST